MPPSSMGNPCLMPLPKDGTIFLLKSDMDGFVTTGVCGSLHVPRLEGFVVVYFLQITRFISEYSFEMSFHLFNHIYPQIPISLYNNKIIVSKITIVKRKIKKRTTYYIISTKNNMECNRGKCCSS